MVPLLAAASAVSTISTLATGAQSMWKSISSAGQAGKKNVAAEPGSFASLLAANGVGVKSKFHSAAASLATTGATAAPAANRLINRVA